MSMSGRNISTIIGIVMIAITFFIFPVLMDGAVEVLEHSSIDSYTGLADVVEVSPLILYVGLLFGGGSMVWYGTKMTSHSKKAGSKIKPYIYKKK